MSTAVKAQVEIGRATRKGTRVAARVDFDEIFFAASEGPVDAAPEAWAAIALLPAMFLGADVRVPRGISPRLAEALPTIQALFNGWASWYRVVRVEAEPAPRAEPPQGTSVGCFFSGGLDSFSTVLRRPEITELIFVHGFDVALENHDLRHRVVAALRKAAADLGKPLLEVETNVRDFTDRHVGWGWCHLAAQAAVAYVLAPRFGKIYIPATHPDAYFTDDSIASGSHPAFPALWSTEQVELVQDGGEAGRLDKARAIAGSEVALKTLRVCWWNARGAYNCCRCEKCLLTMVALRAVGVLERCETFPRPLDPRAVAALTVVDPSSRFFMEENLRALEEAGDDPELIAAVRTSLEPA